jgi:hypothetical protein
LLDINSLDCFDQLSTLGILFDHLRPLLNCKVLLTKESIKKTSCLLIDTFMNWYRSLPFYSILNFDLNQFILNNRWSNYIILVIYYFLKINYIHIHRISYDKCVQRLIEYTQTNLISPVSYRILDQFLNFLLEFFNIYMTNTEFTLLSILLVLRSGNLFTE